MNTDYAKDIYNIYKNVKVGNSTKTKKGKGLLSSMKQFKNTFDSDAMKEPAYRAARYAMTIRNKRMEFKGNGSKIT